VALLLLTDATQASETLKKGARLSQRVYAA